MFWSKLWLFVVTLAAALALATILMLPRPFGRELTRQAGARLEHTQHAASLLLKVNARKWMDTAAQVASDAVLVESLDQATRGPADLALVHKTVQDRLRTFNERMRVDLVMATDAHGRVIARVGLDEDVYRDGVEGLPLMADALRGLRGDDTWALGGKLYRVAASPVIARDHYAGALVVGQLAGAELAQSMKQMLDADVAFVLQGRVIASSSPLPVLADLPALVTAHAAEMEQAGRTAPLIAPDGNRRALLVLAPLAGDLAGAQAVYALIIPQPPVDGVSALLATLAGGDLHTLPWRTLAPVGAALLLALILGFLLLRVEASGPLERLVRDAQSMARGDLSRLDDDRHPGRFGTVARALNAVIDRLAISTQPTAVRNLDAVLRVAPTPFGAARAPVVEPPPPPAFRPEPSAVEPDPGLDFDNRGTEEHARQSLPAVPALIQLAESNSEPSVTERLPKSASGVLIAPEAPTSRVELPEPGLDEIDAPGISLSELAASLPVAPPTVSPLALDSVIPEPPVDTFGGRTAVVSPSAALLRASAPSPPTPSLPPIAPSLSGPPSPAIDDPLETELRSVFEQFIDTKQRCGEATDGVTYDKFAVKLRANRAQLIQRFSCKTVRFVVYVKDGRAALKATPIQT